ncbi:MAG: hypothetical protein P8J45_02595 [Phycisphaerales bacterium]|jgi:hypothetical protein|nr:hypothetical protein [Phycisphaerales bacterium]
MIRTLVASSLLCTSSSFAIDLHVNASAGPYTTVQSAISAAAAGDRVLIQDIGMVTDYVEDIDFLGKDIIVRSDPTNTWPVAIVGTGLGPVVTMNSGEPPSAELSFLYIKGGNAVPPLNAGGGIYMDGSAGMIKNVLINHCTGLLGGGVAIMNSSALLYNVHIVDNNGAASGTYGVAGGGLYVNTSRVTMKGGFIGHNRALMGGGMFTFQSRLDLINVGIEANEGEEGAGLHLANSGYPARIDSCRFVGNLALASTGTRPSAGAGVFAYGCSSTFNRCVFDNNLNLNGPGGNMACKDARTELIDSTFLNGQAFDGGGLFVKRSFVHAERTTLASNWAAFNGGGVCLDTRFSIFVAIDCDLEANQGRRGGAICAKNESDFSLNACRIDQNVAEYGGGIFAAGNLGNRLAVDTQINQNDAFSDGGGLAVFGAAMINFQACRFEDNRAGNVGAGIRAHAANLSLDTSNCCFNNAGAIGGGLYTTACSPVIVNSVVSNNVPNEVTGAFTNIASTIGGGC